MELITGAVFVIGAIASVLAIWDFCAVRWKKWKIKRGGRAETYIQDSKDLQEVLDRPRPMEPINGQQGSNLSRYRLPTIDDLNRGDWADLYDGKRLPFITYGNFFGDGNIDTAFILVGEQSNSAKIVAKRKKDGSINEVLNPAESAFGILLSTAKEGEYKSYWERASLKLETHGIHVSFFEVSSFIFYWDPISERFQEYCMSD